MSKVHSPQYALWLVPLFVLLSVRAAWYWLFVAGNVVMYAAIFAVWSEVAGMPSSRGRGRGPPRSWLSSWSSCGRRTRRAPDARD